MNHDEEQKVLMMKCFETYASFHKLSATEEECTNAVRIVLDDGDIAKYVCKVKENIRNRNLEKIKLAGISCRNNMRWDHIKEIAKSASSLEMKGTIKSTFLGQEYTYKISPKKVEEYSEGKLIATITNYGFVIENYE